RMNMILHDYATAEIKQGNTLANPLFKEGNALKTFDYVVANPPFSDKRWSTGLDAEHDEYQRFQPYGVPPRRKGDYAYLLHILRIVDTFTRQLEIPRYSRLVSVAEISNTRNDYNLNLPRYIDSSELEDLQNIDAHLRGGIPERDIDLLQSYWDVIPSVRAVL